MKRTLPFILLFLSVACTNKRVEHGSAKLFALTPQEFANVPMRLSGTVAARGPSASYFILEDDSGRVFISTHRTVERVACPVGARATLEGKLEKIASENSYYFAMEKLIECQR